jgi:hypothetical protein
MNTTEKRMMKKILLITTCLCLLDTSSLKAEVKEPAAVRYAWADNPAECNLYSKEGFPASPFRTDDWNVGK